MKTNRLTQPSYATSAEYTQFLGLTIGYLAANNRWKINFSLDLLISLTEHSDKSIYGSTVRTVILCMSSAINFYAQPLQENTLKRHVYEWRCTSQRRKRKAFLCVSHTKMYVRHLHH